MAEGDTGSTRSGGAAQGYDEHITIDPLASSLDHGGSLILLAYSDAFQKREQDNENYYMRKKEMEK